VVAVVQIDEHIGQRKQQRAEKSDPTCSENRPVYQRFAKCLQVTQISDVECNRATGKQREIVVELFKGASVFLCFLEKNLLSRRRCL